MSKTRMTTGKVMTAGTQTAIDGWISFSVGNTKAYGYKASADQTLELDN